MRRGGGSSGAIAGTRRHAGKASGGLRNGGSPGRRRPGQGGAGPARCFAQPSGAAVQVDDPAAADADAVQPADAGPAAAALFLVPSMDGLSELVVERRFRRVRHFCRACSPIPRFGWAVLRSLVFAGGSTIGCFVLGFLLAVPDLSAVPWAGVLLRAVHPADADRADRDRLHGRRCCSTATARSTISCRG